MVLNLDRCFPPSFIINTNSISSYNVCAVDDPCLILELCTLFPQSEGPVEHIVDTLLKMLEKDVIDNSKACAEYFEFFKSYASSVSVCVYLSTCLVHIRTVAIPE